MRFDRVSPVRAYERVVEQIEEAVLCGRLRPGEHLPSERDLMVQFGVGRSTVREALRVLQSNGLVRSRAGDPRGAQVQAVSPGALQKSMTMLARADTLGLAELVQFRMLLEGSANQLAARLRTPEQLAEMDTAMDVMRTAVDEGYAEFSRADVAFHEAVARATGNTLIQICGTVVRDVVLGLIEDKIVNAPDSRALMLTSLEHHSRVLEAVRDGDGELAARLARRSLYDYYAEYVPEDERAMLLPLLD
ncbi:FadR/GntR family transcriptional regulator [Allokutzneria oryzae]|uniref:FadR/GntR family transcriptional regulator n=1 Tax=Allokutzneria oryzae TaxID=1378989 RepID=A0ABV5ZPK6_9PSEU